jgi:hypothetical protein
MICAWIETSSAERLVADDQGRLERERPRDADALALAARQLVRIAAAVLGQEPHLPEQLLHAGGPIRRLLDEAVDGERLAHDLAYGHPRVQRAVGVLEDDLDAPAHRPERRRRERGELLPLEAHRPAGRPLELENAAPCRGFAAAGLAHEPERLAAPDREADAVDRPHQSDLAAEQPR